MALGCSRRQVVDKYVLAALMPLYRENFSPILLADAVNAGKLNGSCSRQVLMQGALAGVGFIPGSVKKLKVIKASFS